ncbi:MAG: thioredoxin domain-containing protein, partial [Planctomycetota bacterium]
MTKAKTTPDAKSPQRTPMPLWAMGMLTLLVSLVACTVLVGSGLDFFEAPGCTADSPCSKAADSKFGSLPFTDNKNDRIVPVSFVGFAFTIGMIAMWVRGLKRSSAITPWLAGAGAMASVGYLGIIVANAEEYLCPWCITAHIGNILFFFVTVLTVSVMPRPERRLAGMVPTLATSAAGFAIALVVTVGADAGLSSVKEAGIEAEGQDDIAQILGGPGTETGKTEQLTSTTVTPPVEVEPVPVVTESTASQEESAQVGTKVAPVVNTGPRDIEQILVEQGPFNTEGFGGRYIIGAPEAELRIVTVSTYQCPACIEKEKEIVRLMEEFPGRVNLSVIHSPISTACNPYTERDMHPNGCWAARAAEAAGILAGPEGFRAMNNWLYQNRGTFTSFAPLNPVIDAMGASRVEFATVMQSEETLDRVQQDIEFARNTLGTYQTPTIYINGVEFRGWPNPDAVYNAGVQLLNSGRLVARPNTADSIPGYEEKRICDFFKGRLYNINYTPRTTYPDAISTVIKPADQPIATLDIRVSGSVLMEMTWKLQAILEEAIASLPETVAVRFTNIHNPYNSTCNGQLSNLIERHRQRAIAEGRDPSGVKDIIGPEACMLHHAIEAVASLDSAGAAIEVRDWMLRREGVVTEQDAVDHITSTYSIEEDLLRLSMSNPTTMASVRSQGEATSRLNNGTLVLYVNGKYIPPASWNNDKGTLATILKVLAGLEDAP